MFGCICICFSKVTIFIYPCHAHVLASGVSMHPAQLTFSYCSHFFYFSFFLQHWRESWKFLLLSECLGDFVSGTCLNKSGPIPVGVLMLKTCQNAFSFTLRVTTHTFLEAWQLNSTIPLRSTWERSHTFWLPTSRAFGISFEFTSFVDFEKLFSSLISRISHRLVEGSSNC